MERLSQEVNLNVAFSKMDVDHSLLKAVLPRFI